jgi:hypothetical protein
MTVERPALDQLQVKAGRTLKDRVQPGLTADDRKECHLHVVDEAGDQQRPRSTRLPRERNGTGLLFEPGDERDPREAALGARAPGACSGRGGG